MGYGGEALRQLGNYLKGNILIDEEKSEKFKQEGKRNEKNSESVKERKSCLENNEEINESNKSKDDEIGREDEKKCSNEFRDALRAEVIQVKEAPPLLQSCRDKLVSVEIDYLGTSFGLTLDLFKFHQRLGFQPVYLRQSPSDITGESGCD